MNTLSKLEKLAELKTSGGDVVVETTEETVTKEEMDRLTSYDNKAALKKELASSGIVLGRYLTASLFAISSIVICDLFVGHISLGDDTLLTRLHELVFWIFFVPSIIIFPVYVIRSKERHAAREQAKAIACELQPLAGGIANIRRKISLAASGIAKQETGSNITEPVQSGGIVRNVMLAVRTRDAVVTITSVVSLAAFCYLFSGPPPMNRFQLNDTPSKIHLPTRDRDPRDVLNVFLKSRFPRAQNLTIYQNGQIGNSHFYNVEVYPGSGSAAWDSYEAVVEGGRVTRFGRQ